MSAKPSQEWNDSDLLEIRARERTFEGAYTRTALNALGTGVLVMRVFSTEFFALGLVFVAYGVTLLILGRFRRRKLLHKQPDIWAPFRTGGRYVLATALITLITQITLLILLLRM
jgi:uncharacterized membrane protein YidH (DUF202 family)